MARRIGTVMEYGRFCNALSLMGAGILSNSFGHRMPFYAHIRPGAAYISFGSNAQGLSERQDEF